ncbi:acyltransferase family protein [Rhodoferax koreense]|nr:acyltransferase family protein [Rhodoferax koreense]
MVILNHFHADWMPSGFIGVDVFFVISGYVITLNLASKQHLRFAEFCLGFYAHRIKRLFPALCLMVVLSSVAISLFNPDAHRSINTGWTALFGASNIFLWAQANDYFSGATQLNPFTHTWSLGVEEQFYFVFPVILWIGLVKLGHRPRLLTYFLAATCTLSVVSFLVYSQLKPMAAYYLMPTRFWELASGAMLALGTRRSRSRPGRRFRNAPAVAMAGLFSTCLLPATWFSVSIPMAVLFTAAMIHQERRDHYVYDALSGKVAVHLGRVSYSLYLWHWPLLVVGKWTIGAGPLASLAVLLTVILFAEMSFRHVEQPFRLSRWGPTEFRTLSYGLGALSITAVLLHAGLKPIADGLYLGIRPALAERGAESLARPYTAIDGLAWAGEKCVLQSNRDVGKTIDPQACSFGASPNPRRIIVFGNSFSAAFLHGLEELARNDRFTITLTSSWGASATPNMPNKSEWSAVNTYYWDKIYPELASSLKSGDWVFLMSDLHDFSPSKASLESRDLIGRYRSELSGMAQQLGRRRVKLAVLHGNPFAREAQCEPAIALAQWFSPFGRPCNFYGKEDTLQRRRPLDIALKSLGSQIVIVDLLDVFCPSATCNYEGKSGEVLYRDGWSHPSAEAARLSYPILRDAFTALR